MAHAWGTTNTCWPTTSYIQAQVCVLLLLLVYVSGIPSNHCTREFPNHHTLVHDAQDKVDAAYRDQKQWTRMSIMSTAGSGKFSTDRTIAEYAKDIWWVPHSKGGRCIWR